MTIEQASEFYELSHGERNNPLTIMSLSGGPIFVMCLSKPNAVESWKEMMGPENVIEAKSKQINSLRARYGQLNDLITPNLVYGSQHLENVEQEIRFFFPEITFIHNLDESSINRYLQANIYHLLFDGLYKCARLQPDDPITWIAKWLLENNPNKPIYIEKNKISIVNNHELPCQNINISKNNTSPSKLKSSIASNSLIDKCSSGYSQSNTFDSSSYDLLEKNFICPNCQKMIQIIYRTQNFGSSVILEDAKHSTFAEITQNDSLQTNFLNDCEPVECGSCKEDFRSNLKCLDKIASNLNLKFGCNNKTEF